LSDIHATGAALAGLT